MDRLRYIQMDISNFNHIGKQPRPCFAGEMKRLRHPERPGLHLRVVIGGKIAMGPGRAELLEGIAETGSIAAAGRRMGMSYKRAWQLVEAMNATFANPLVNTAKGGAGGGSATLTTLGSTILTSYRCLEKAADKASAGELARIKRAMARTPG